MLIYLLDQFGIMAFGVDSVSNDIKSNAIELK